MVVKKFAIIIPYKFTASQNILEHLKKLKLPENVEIVEVEKESIHNENLDKEVEADYFIFATRHQSEARVKSLCVHVPGNFKENKVGGRVRELNWAMPSFMKSAVRFLEKNKLKDFKLKDFEVELEATHHGPYLEKPVMFIEIGSSEEEWANKKAGKLIAEAILEIVKNKKKFKSCIVLGGGHYNKVGKKLMLNSEYAVGHICPKYQLENLDVELLNQMIKRSDEKVELIVLDWKGLKEKEKIKKLLEKVKIKYVRYDKLKCGKCGSI